ncbi:hypothetical protein GCM10027070_05280 [Barrientosiimonas humi]
MAVRVRRVVLEGVEVGGGALVVGSSLVGSSLVEEDSLVGDGVVLGVGALEVVAAGVLDVLDVAACSVSPEHPASTTIAAAAPPTSPRLPALRCLMPLTLGRAVSPRSVPGANPPGEGCFGGGFTLGRVVRHRPARGGAPAAPE